MTRVSNKDVVWLQEGNKNNFHEFLGCILDHSATPTQFEEICERIKDSDDAREERSVLIDCIYELVGEAISGTKRSRGVVMQRVYKAFWKLENTDLK